jgi:hypothetical protein
MLTINGIRRLKLIIGFQIFLPFRQLRIFEGIASYIDEIVLL